MLALGFFVVVVVSFGFFLFLFFVCFCLFVFCFCFCFLEKGTSYAAVLVGMQAGTATLENSMEVPQDVKNRATQDPTIALLGFYPKDTDVVK